MSQPDHFLKPLGPEELQSYAYHRNEDIGAYQCKTVEANAPELPAENVPTMLPRDSHTSAHQQSNLGTVSRSSATSLRMGRGGGPRARNSAGSRRTSIAGSSRSKNSRYSSSSFPDGDISSTDPSNLAYSRGFRLELAVEFITGLGFASPEDRESSIRELITQRKIASGFGDSENPMSITTEEIAKCWKTMCKARSSLWEFVAKAVPEIFGLCAPGEYAQTQPVVELQELYKKKYLRAQLERYAGKSSHYLFTDEHNVQCLLPAAKKLFDYYLAKNSLPQVPMYRHKFFPLRDITKALLLLATRTALDYNLLDVEGKPRPNFQTEKHVVPFIGFLKEIRDPANWSVWRDDLTNPGSAILPQHEAGPSSTNPQPWKEKEDCYLNALCANDEMERTQATGACSLTAAGPLPSPAYMPNPHWIARSFTQPEDSSGTLLPNSAQSNPGYDLEDYTYSGPLLTSIDARLQAFNFSDSTWDFMQASHQQGEDNFMG